jgi:septal ring factor EnvC (AmiA/AmiB activator)
MSSANKALLIVMVVATLGLWGCAQNPGSSAHSARIRDLESRNAKLEEDYRAVVSTRDQYRKRLNSTEERKAELTQELEAALRERDELRQLVSTRQGERDALHGQLIQLGKELQSLAGRIEAATATTANPPVTSAAPVGNPDSNRDFESLRN